MSLLADILNGQSFPSPHLSAAYRAEVCCGLYLSIACGAMPRVCMYVSVCMEVCHCKYVCVCLYMRVGVLSGGLVCRRGADQGDEGWMRVAARDANSTPDSLDDRQGRNGTGREHGRRHDLHRPSHWRAPQTIRTVPTPTADS